MSIANNPITHPNILLHSHKQRSIDLSLFTIMKQYKNIRHPKTKKQFYCPPSNEQGINSHSNNAEYEELISNISILQHEVDLPDKDIQPILNALEFSLSSSSNSNNDTNKTQLFFLSKCYTDLIHSITIARKEYIDKILSFIEKLLLQRQIAKYLSNDLNFIRTILSFAIYKNCYESSIKIAEILLMNNNHLISMKYIEEVIVNAYKCSVLNQNVNTFCRLLTILLFDYKKIEFKRIFRNKEHLRIQPLVKAIVENQNICLNLDRFINNIICALSGIFEKTKTIANDTLLTRTVVNIIFEPYDEEIINVELMIKENEDEEILRNEEIGRILLVKYDELIKIIQMNVFQRFTWKEEKKDIILIRSNDGDDVFNNKNKPNRNEVQMSISSQVKINIPAMLQSKDRIMIEVINQSNDNKDIKEQINQSLSSISSTISLQSLLLQSNITTNTQSGFITKPHINIHNIYSKLTKVLSLLISKSKINDDCRKYTTMIKHHSHQIEMIFVLSTLLSSKRKIEIQETMKEMNIVKVLSSYLEYMEWGNIFSGSKRPMFTDEQINYEDDSVYHGEGCCCDIDNALKIQYLRLLYTYYSRDISNIHNKIGLLSTSDISRFISKGYSELLLYSLDDYYKIYNTNLKASFNKAFQNIYTSLKLKSLAEENKIKKRSIKEILIDMTSIESFKENVTYYNAKQHDDVGLLQKIIYKYMQECYYSSAKFWLASCIEVVLRGNNTFIQTYIINSGLVPCILYDILYTKTEHNEILQFSFDILGELIKFNRGSFFILNYYLEDKVEFSHFTKKAIQKKTLIDSNVFLRSIILSKYYFDKHDKENGIKNNDWFTQQCNLCMFINKNINEIFISLISIVKPIDINQTNISCINSSLLILIIEYLKGTLTSFIIKLREMYPIEAKSGMENFKILLQMWKDFYNYRPKDSASLQHSTTINFDIWQKVNYILLTEEL